MSSITELISRKPKNVVIADAIREQIVSGTLPNGARLLSDDEFARKYNVNKRTVAAGLNTLVKEGLIERIPRQGTFVAGNLNGSKTSNAVGMIMLSKGDVYSNINRSITRGFADLNLYPILISDQLCLDKASVKSFIKAILNEQVTPYGFLIDGGMKFLFDFLKKDIDKFHNIVFINKYNHPEKIAKAKYALIDFAEAGRLAARHFIAQGHKKIACLAMPENTYAGVWGSIQAKIQQGFAEVCRESSVQYNEDIFWKLIHGAPLTETVNKLLSGAERPDAIFAYNDSFVRFQLLPLLKNAKDIELIGFYNTPHAEKCGFSSICIHEEKIAENAIKLLTNKTKEKEVFIKPELVVRKR
jgi:DNA-binding LacI/PurR family transcriptional regulator